MSCSFPAEHHILGNGHGIDQHEVLVNHTDSRRDRVTRPMSRERPPLESNGPGIWLHHTEEHLHQSALARPIFAKETENPAVWYRQVDIAIGMDRSVPLAHAAHFEHRRHFGIMQDTFEGSHHAASRIVWSYVHLQLAGREFLLELMEL